MFAFADFADIGVDLPWQWPVGAILCWGIVLCLGLIYLKPEPHPRLARAVVRKRRPSHGP